MSEKSVRARLFLDSNVLTGGIVARRGLDRAVLSLCAARICRLVLAEEKIFSIFLPVNSPRLHAGIRASVTAMSTEHENSEELIIIYCHHFDATSGLYVQSLPISVCYENELHGALEAINASVYYENYLLETVSFTELSPEDKLEIIEQFSEPEILLRQIIPGAYNLGDELLVYG